MLRRNPERRYELAKGNKRNKGRKKEKRKSILSERTPENWVATVSSPKVIELKAPKSQRAEKGQATGTEPKGTNSDKPRRT